MTPEEAAEFSATRRAMAMVLKRLARLEAKVNAVTTSREQYEEEKIRRREARW
jgi:hypothetical protein